MAAISVRNCSSLLSFGLRCSGKSIRDQCVDSGVFARWKMRLQPLLIRCHRAWIPVVGGVEKAPFLSAAALRVLCLGPRSRQEAWGCPARGSGAGHSTWMPSIGAQHRMCTSPSASPCTGGLVVSSPSTVPGLPRHSRPAILPFSGPCGRAREPVRCPRHSDCRYGGLQARRRPPEGRVSSRARRR